MWGITSEIRTAVLFVTVDFAALSNTGRVNVFVL